MKKNTSKKKLCCLLTFFLLFNTVAYAQTGENEKNNKDPYEAFHNEISDMVASIREIGDSNIELIENQIYELNTESVFLLEQNLNINSIESTQMRYNDILSEINELEEEIVAIKKETDQEIASKLKEKGFIFCTSRETESDSDIVNTMRLQGCDAGNMQTSSYVHYYPATKEFYYYVCYDYNAKNSLGAYVGLDDSWGDYDLVSMQLKDDNGWYWNNIRVTAKLAYGFYNNNIAGIADKYSIIDSGLSGTSHVSNRNDFWNGCIFNVKDSHISMPQSFSSEIRYVYVEGWLKTAGTSRSSQVKSEYEHNYEDWELGDVKISGTGLDYTNYKMEVSYSHQEGRWSRSAGSLVVTIPSGC